MVVGMMAIMKAGSAYLPIDPAFPGKRKEYLLRDSSAKLLLTGRSLSEEVNKLKVNKLEVESWKLRAVFTPLFVNILSGIRISAVGGNLVFPRFPIFPLCPSVCSVAKMSTQ